MKTHLELPPAERPGESLAKHRAGFRCIGRSRAASDPDRFDWSTDDSVLLGEQFATAVYRNKRDAIVIRQEGSGDEDDHFVILRDAEAARLLIGALHREIKGGH